MNNNSNTRKFSSAKRRTHSRIDSRHRAKRIILIVSIVIIIALLVGAIIFLALDFAGVFSDDTTIPSDTTGADVAPSDHPSTNAYDGDPNTYYLSASNQVAGSYFIVSFTKELSVSDIEIISSHPDHYIRGASVALSTDNKNWTALDGSLSGPDAFAVTLSQPIFASHLRIMITEAADTNFAIDEIRVTDSTGESAVIRGAMSGQTTTPPPADETTKPPADETTAAPETGYTNLTISNEKLHIGDLILVNSQYDYKFLHDPSSILDLYNEVAANNITSFYQQGGTLLNATAMQALFEMCGAVMNETGYRSLLIGDGYRSKETQENLYSKYPTTAAVPGYSEHHTALGVDLKIWDNEKGVTYTLEEGYVACAPIRNWLSTNACKYGFVRRFSPDKDAITGISSDRWHYRYVGYPHAYFMNTNNLCLEEYLALLENTYQYGSRHLDINDGTGGVWEVYFVPASAGATTTVPVPVSGNYTISGNNYSGYIVTVEIS